PAVLDLVCELRLREEIEFDDLVHVHAGHALAGRDLRVRDRNQNGSEQAQDRQLPHTSSDGVRLGDAVNLRRRAPQSKDSMAAARAFFVGSYPIGASIEM